MNALSAILITLVSAFAMEFVAWATHKYIMHGILWKWHEDHHKPHYKEGKFFEKNDLFFLVFATPGIALLMLGTFTQGKWMFFVGLGITIYGAIYFLIHDVYIHQRFPWFKHLNNRYSRAILRAHGAHHAKTEKEGCESFGLLLVDPKYFKKRSNWNTRKAAE